MYRGILPEVTLVGRSDSHAGCARPDPLTGGGMGKPGFPIPLRGGGVGKPGFPTPLLQQPMFTLAVHAIRAQRRNEHTIVPGRAAPAQTLPPVGAWGNPVSPCPCGAGAWGNPVSPHPLRKGCVLTFPGAGVWGNLVPPCSPQPSMRLRRTTPR